jgi:hypothetical protein
MAGGARAAELQTSDVELQLVRPFEV